MNIISIDSDVTHWPNKKMKRCTCVGPDNKKYEITISIEELELIMFLKNIMISESLRSKLSGLISKFADEKYSDGYENCEMDNSLDNG